MWTGQHTIESCVHAPNVDQKADHGHPFGGIPITKQFVAQDFAGLAAPGHCVDVKVGEALLADGFGLIAVGEDLLVVIEDGLEEVILDVLPPERLAIVFL